MLPASARLGVCVLSESGCATKSILTFKDSVEQRLCQELLLNQGATLVRSKLASSLSKATGVHAASTAAASSSSSLTQIINDKMLIEEDEPRGEQQAQPTKRRRPNEAPSLLLRFDSIAAALRCNEFTTLVKLLQEKKERNEPLDIGAHLSSAQALHLERVQSALAAIYAQGAANPINALLRQSVDAHDNGRVQHEPTDLPRSTSSRALCSD